MASDGAGIMCAIAAAIPERRQLLAVGRAGRRGRKQGVGEVELVLPSRELEFDLRGAVEVASDRSWAHVDVGEIKQGMDYGAAVPQLGVRLRVLQWLLHTCRGVPSGHVRLVGRMAVLDGHPPRAEASQVDLAQREWGFTLLLN